MSKFRIKDKSITFWCPGCNEAHKVTINESGLWTYSGDENSVTIRPSILITSGHYIPNYSPKECWCTYNEKHKDDPAPFKCERCHSFVTDGRIQFLNDCTHSLAGKEVEIQNWNCDVNN